MSQDYVVKDSGTREEYDSGMVRDTQEGKTEYDRVFDGPMLDRWAEHLTKGAAKYPDDPGPNWMRANSPEELRRFRKSAVRHFRQWLRGDTDEDHAAAVFFNVNAHEYVRGKFLVLPTVEEAPVPVVEHTPHYHDRLTAFDGNYGAHRRFHEGLSHNDIGDGIPGSWEKPKPTLEELQAAYPKTAWHVYGSDDKVEWHGRTDSRARPHTHDRRGFHFVEELPA